MHLNLEKEMTKKKKKNLGVPDVDSIMDVDSI